jgi:hypothetical protein
MKIILAALLTAVLSGCGSIPTRAENPEHFALIDSGRVPTTSADALIECITDGFIQANARNTAYSVKQSRRSDGHRIEVYGSNVILRVSADVFQDGRTELRLGPDPFQIFVKEPIAYRECVARLSIKS